MFNARFYEPDNKEAALIRSPADGCVVPKAQHQEMKTLQPKDLKACLGAAERRNALAMFYLELVSGIRKGALVALRWEGLDVEQWTISAMLGHYDAGFTLRTHTTRQKQDKAPQAMGSLMAQVR